jgi:hypothetical protein
LKTVSSEGVCQYLHLNFDELFIKRKAVPLQARCVPEGSRRFRFPDFHDIRQLEGGEVVTLTHRPPLPPGVFLVLIFTRGCVEPRAMVRSEGNMSLKNPVTPLGIDPLTTTPPQAPTNSLLVLTLSR